MPFEPAYGLFFDDRDERGNPRRAVCAAASSLTMQLERYLTGEVKGRSCLIAGPRGAGKTTLIDTAHSLLESRMAAREQAKLAIRVSLHGPSLLQPPEPEKPVGERQRQELAYEHILKSLIVNLYQTAAEEFANRYLAHVATRGAEARERAAQLRLTLDGAPSAATLRQFWDAAGAVERGVLFEAGQPADQGVCEITLLATAAEAYRKCTGKLESKDTDLQSAGRREALKAQAEAKGRELGKAIAGLLTGIAAGGGAALAGASPGLALTGGAAAALLGMLSLSYSAGISQQLAARRDITFLPDTSVSGLVHRVPLLLRRFRQAGVYPFFVIDELDKVRRLERTMDDLVAHLKFLCADNAFFCFLTDRTYLAAIAAKNRAAANSRLLTVFTDPLYVFYDTASFRQYLKDVCKVGGTVNEQTRQELQYDLEAFHLAVMHRSRMLIFNLIRELSASRKGATRFPIELQAPRRLAEFQIYVMLQLAIEVTLRNEGLSSRIGQNPDFAQVVYDVLYYPTARWQQNEEDLDCTLGGVTAGMEAMSAAGDSRGVEGKCGLASLAEDDQRSVHAHLLDYLALVCDRAALRQRLNETPVGVDAVVCDLVNDAPPLLQPLDERGKYRWLLKPDGTPFRVARLEELAQQSRAPWAAAEAFATELARVPLLPELAEILQGLDAPLAVLERFEATLSEIAGKVLWRPNA